jgi:hypothetical protein
MQSVTVTEGSDATFVCKARQLDVSDGPLGPAKWSKNGDSLTAGNITFTAERPVLAGY